MFEPKTLAPLPDSQVLTRLDQSGSSAKISTLLGAPGELSEPGLAADLAASGNRLAWLRPSTFDLRPSPAPRQNVRSSPTTTVVDAHQGALGSPLFLPYLFDVAARSGGGDVIVLADRETSTSLPGARVNQPTLDELMRMSSLDRLRSEPYGHLLELVGNRSGTIPSLARSLWNLGSQRFEWAIMAAATMSDLIGNIVSLNLARVAPAHFGALEAACLLGYAHESLPSMGPLLPSAATEPWWEPLSQGWLRLPPLWKPALAQQCAGRSPAARHVQADLVDHLVSDGAICEAIDIRMSTGAFDDAAKLIWREADNLVAGGQHDVLVTWLDRLPLDQVRKGRQLRKLHQSCKARTQVEREEDRVDDVGDLRMQPTQRPLFADPAIPVDVKVIAIDLLGPLRVTVGETVVKGWTGATGRNLLRYIAALHPRPVTAERLQETFWPDVAPRTSKNRLHVALHTLRGDLRRYGVDNILDFRDGAYHFVDNLEVKLDIARFATLLAESVGETDPSRVIAVLEEAHAVYRGDFLEDAPYENWPTVEREMWKVRYLGLLECLAHTYFLLGSYRECIGVSQELIAKDLCRDDVHQLVMRSYARLDQPHLAMRQFELCRAQLQADLGKEPGAELVELLGSIQRRESI
jgi:DNA-binding SARP family transcriptional activator